MIASLRHHSQKSAVAARAMSDKKTVGAGVEKAAALLKQEVVRDRALLGWRRRTVLQPGYLRRLRG